ncbi:MAG: hypothetical protein LQ350_006714 [Teloschistes chrysophthalmus]|nr:MAG: hypothetical protein LQ350_006714 [Niorma chrysophthalma]
MAMATPATTPENSMPLGPAGPQYGLLVPMPLPGTQGVPFFNGQNATEFFSRFEDLCDDYRQSIAERFRRLPRYCETAHADTIKSLPEYEDKNDWEKLKKAVLKEYLDHDTEQQLHSRRFLEVYKSKPRSTIEETRDFCRFFKTASMRLKQKNQLDSFTRAQWFIEGMPPSLREKLVRKLNIDPDDSETMDFDKIHSNAVAIVNSLKAVEKFSGSKALADDMSDLADKYQAKAAVDPAKKLSPPVVEPPKVTTIEDITEKFAALSLPTKAITEQLSDTVRSLSAAVIKIHGGTSQNQTTNPGNPGTPSGANTTLPEQGCYGCGDPQCRIGRCSKMGALRAQGKFHYNADHRICLGTTDRPGPEVRRQRGQTFVQAIEAAASQSTTPDLVRTSALRLGAAASPEDIDDDTDEEDDEADEPRDAATVNTVRPTWPPSANKDALQDRANAESNLPGMKILRPGHYAQKISKEPTAPKVRFQNDDAMVIDDQDAVTVAIPKKKKEDYKSASQPLRRRKLDTLPDTVSQDAVFERILDQASGLTVREVLAISPDMRRRFYRREDQPTAQGAVSVNTAAVDRGVRCFSTRTLDQPADLELYAAGCPEVKATVNDTPLMAMIDSGSEINVISGAKARSAGLAWRTGPTLQLLGVNGKLTKFLGVCNGVEIDVGGAKRRMPIFVVDECDYDMILGRVYERKTRLCAQNHDDGTCDITVLGENDVQVTVRAVLADSPGNRSVSDVFLSPRGSLKE